MKKNNKQNKLSDFCDKKYSRFLNGDTYVSQIELGNYHIMIRFSSYLHYDQLGRKHACMDVVQLGYIPYRDFQVDTHGVPKRGATWIWETLETWCKIHNLSLRAESVLSNELMTHILKRDYIYERGTDLACIQRNGAGLKCSDGESQTLG